MFGATEQKLNQYKAQMAEFLKKQTTDKTELKRKHETQMANFRTILLKSKFQPSPVTTPVLPVAFPTFAFTFTTERKKILPKLPIYHGIKKSNHGISRFERSFRWILPIYRNGTYSFTSITS